ncbi:hypothetical protein NM962_20860 [Mycobacterium sp. SVM_VP21]|nr:hypothetical protein NM962_20860 [Mycobacterium sp. SVM_VP21]
MVRSRRTKVPAEEKTRLVLAVLAREMTGAEAARRGGGDDSGHHRSGDR